MRPSAPRLEILEIDHVNQLIAHADAAADHYERLYGADVREVFRQRTGPYDNFIFKMGTMTLEVFSPVDPAHSFGRQHARFGNCWQGCLWRVPDLEEAITTLRGRGIPLVDVNLERGWAFTDPRVTYFSIQLEDLADWDKSPTPNACGIEGLHGFGVAVEDTQRAADFFRDLLEGAETLYEEERPALDATAVGLRVADYVMELQGPLREGELSAFLRRYRQRIRTATWKVASLDAVAAHFAEHGVTLIAGDRDGTLAIAAEDNLGVTMQFVE